MKSLQLNEPHVIIMVGIPGSGKSFFAEHFAATFNIPLVSYSNLKNELFTKHTGNNSGHTATKKVASILLKELIKTNQTLVYDGITDTNAERKKLIDVANKAGYTPTILWVQTDTSSAKMRATKRTKDGVYLSDDEFTAALSSFMPPNKSENPIVISGKHTYASQLKIVLKRLTETRPQLIEKDALKKRLLNRRINVR